jgi:hypothetical protein
MLGSPLGCFLALRGVSADAGAGLGSAASGPLMQVGRREELALLGFLTLIQNCLAVPAASGRLC